MPDTRQVDYRPLEVSSGCSLSRRAANILTYQNTRSIFIRAPHIKAAGLAVGCPNCPVQYRVPVSTM